MLAVGFPLLVLVLGVGWVVWNIATANGMTWFAGRAQDVTIGALIIAVWLLAIVLPIRWWRRARQVGAN
jgi:hypothetical protein